MPVELVGRYFGDIFAYTMQLLNQKVLVNVIFDDY